jgi:hypothetical protein
MEKVQFQTNVPVEIALKFESGKDVTGQYGDQVLYTLTDGRVIYVPPIVRKQIASVKAGPGAKWRRCMPSSWMRSTRCFRKISARLDH